MRHEAKAEEKQLLSEWFRERDDHWHGMETLCAAWSFLLAAMNTKTALPFPFVL